MKMYISVHTPRGIINFFLLFFFAEATSRVHFVTAFLGNVVMRKTKKCVSTSPNPPKKNPEKKATVIVLCFDMDSELLFSFWGGNVCWKMVKWYRLSLSYWFCSEYEYCVLLCRNPENRVAKKSNNLQFYTGMCIFMFCTFFFSQRWSLSLTVSASICVAYSHLFHIEKYMKTYS